MNSKPPQYLSGSDNLSRNSCLLEIRVSQILEWCAPLKYSSDRWGKELDWPDRREDPYFFLLYTETQTTKLKFCHSNDKSGKTLQISTLTSLIVRCAVSFAHRETRLVFLERREGKYLFQRRTGLLICNMHFLGE